MSSTVETTQADLYLLSIARQMRSEDIIHVGASQLEVWQAAEVARLLWAPGVRVVAAGSFHLSTRLAGNPDLMTARSYGRDVVAGREATLSQTHVFNDLIRARVVFSGAMQVDVRGNGNLIGFESGSRFVRGPGSAGLPTLTSVSKRFFFALPRHSRTVLVPKVHRISVLGDPVARESLGLPAEALQEVITPLASFGPGADGLRLTALSPGVSMEDVQRETGFDIHAAPDVMERNPASSEELSALRYVRGEMTTRRSNER